MKQSLLKILRKRDPYCVHCGDDDTLVPHHRINRGMGGSKILDDPRNVIMVCSRYNGDMESRPETASRARQYGHKLSRFDTFEKPLYDQVTGAWIVLDSKGGKHEQTDRGLLVTRTF